MRGFHCLRLGIKASEGLGFRVEGFRPRAQCLVVWGLDFRSWAPSTRGSIPIRVRTAQLKK